MNNFDVAEESFPWVSEAQKKSYLAIVQYVRQFGMDPDSIDPVVAFLCQAMHDSHEHQMEVTGGQVGAINQELAQLKASVQKLEQVIDIMTQLVKSNTAAVELLTKK